MLDSVAVEVLSPSVKILPGFHCETEMIESGSGRIEASFGT